MPCECTRRASSLNRPRLADSRLTRHQHRRSLTRQRVVPEPEQGVELGVTPDERESTGRLQAVRKGQPAGLDAITGFPFDPQRRDGRGQPFQLEGTDGSEALRGARPRHHSHDLRAQDLATLGLCAQAGRFDHRRAAEIVVLEPGVAEADAHPNAESLDVAVIPLVDRLLHGDRGRDAVGRAEEGGHDPVTRGVDHFALVGIDRFAQDQMVTLVQHVGGIVTEAGTLRGRTHQVGEHHGVRRADRPLHRGILPLHVGAAPL